MSEKYKATTNLGFPVIHFTGRHRPNPQLGYVPAEVLEAVLLKAAPVFAKKVKGLYLTWERDPDTRPEVMGFVLGPYKIPKEILDEGEILGEPIVQELKAPSLSVVTKEESGEEKS